MNKSNKNKINKQETKAKQAKCINFNAYIKMCTF